MSTDWPRWRTAAIIAIAMLVGAGYPALDYLLIRQHDSAALIVSLSGLNPAAGLAIGTVFGASALLGAHIAGRVADARRSVYADLWPAAGASAAVITCWALPLILLTSVLGVTANLTWLDHLAFIGSVAGTFAFFFVPRMRQLKKGLTDGDTVH